MSATQTPQAPKTDAVAHQRTPAEIEVDIVAARDRLVATVDQLQAAVKRATNPKRILVAQLSRVKGFYVDEYGGVRPERIVVTVGVVVGVIVVRKATKRIFR